jgi:hypothetical protein
MPAGLTFPVKITVTVINWPTIMCIMLEEAYTVMVELFINTDLVTITIITILSMI